MQFFFFAILSNKHRRVLPVNNQQRAIINGICGTFNTKPNYFGPVIPSKLRKFRKIGLNDDYVQKCVSINR